jgi:DNA-binding protein H-NS
MRAVRQETEPKAVGSMSAKKLELEAMSVDDLWSLHERISGILSARIKAEKRELEKRLAILSRGADRAGQNGSLVPLGERPRRRYPVVLPKYRNPQTSETWSGRGKRPRWLVAAMKSGRKIEEFRINENNRTSLRPA